MVDISTDYEKIMYKIKDPNLKAILFGSEECKPSNKVINVPGFFNEDHNMRSRGLLTYCVEHAFNLLRSTDYEETCITSVEEILQQLKAEELKNIFNEIQALYAHTQTSLLNNHEEKILAYRGLNNHEVSQVHRQISAKKPFIELHTNTLVSYTLSDIYFSFRPIILRHEINVKDILTHYKYLAYPIDERGCYLSSNADYKEYELLVINRDSYGKMLIPTDNFEVDEKQFNKFMGSLKRRVV